MANVKDLLVNGSARVIGTIYGNATSATNSDKLDGKHLNEIAAAKSTTLAWNTSSTIATIGGNNITVTMPANPNTWRGIQNNLTSDSTTDSLSAAQGKALKSLIDGKAASSHTHDDRYYTESEINTKLNAKLNTSLKGTASGLAELDANGKVPSTQLPSYVDDVIEGYLYNNKFYKESGHTTVITGETGKIYIDLSNNKTYRWSGSTYAVISETLALGETSSTAYRGDRGKTAYDHSQSTHARTDATKVEASSTNGKIKINGSEVTVYTHPSGTNPHGTTKSDIGLGNVGNFKAVSTVASQGLTDTEKANARANIGAGTSSFSGSYNDLSNKPTIPTVGNGTITITQNGTSKGTFTTNQSGNTTIALTDNNTTYSNATTSAAGLMSKDDKAKLDGITASADAVSFSRSLTSGTKVGTITINGTGTDLYAPTNTDTHWTTGLKVGASNTATANAAASNGSVYLNILDNSTVRDSHKITGSGATSVTSDANGVITISSTNTTYGVATSSANGLMSSSDKSKLDGIAAGANKYSHPTSSGNKHIPAGGSSGQILRWSADGTAVWGADNNTWRGIQNNLTSDSTTDSLAAAQGKALKALIDGKAASSHTHNYAGSSSAGGAANSANKLATARTITLSGAVTGSASFDGSKNITITTTGSQQTLPYSSSTSQLFVTTTANQANYTLSNFIDNAVYHVYVNGFKIPSSEYTVSSSGVVTLTNPPELANQEVEIVANYTSYVTTDSSINNSSYLNYYRQATAPSNTNALWLDTSATTSSSSFTPKLYDGGKWNTIGGADTATLDTRYVKKTGDSVSGIIRSNYKSGTWVNSLTNSVISIDDTAGSYGGWICGPTKNGRIAISTYENSDDVLYFGYGEKGRTTNSFAQQMTWNGATNTLSAGKVYGAVWNDYAEFRIGPEEFKPGQVVCEVGDDSVSLTTKRLQRGCSIISDTFGFAIGETDKAKCPLAVSGRVLAYGYEPIEKFKSHIGYPVCSGPNGTVSIMTDEEEEKYPSRIIGIISAVPEYEEWGTGKVKIDGRIWIKLQ